MRWLTKRLEGQTRHEHESRGESGAILVFVAISLVVLLGSVAMSIDFGRMYSERRELQNGADAAALAVAQDCATGDCGGAYSPYPIAEEYADANASDNLAWVDDVDLDLAAQKVTVHTATEDPGGDHFFDMMFAQIVGFDGLTVNAQATVAWGAPKNLATLPIIFSICEWEQYSGTLHPSSAVINNELPPTPGYGRLNDYTQIFFHGDDENSPICHESPSGQDLPGGFGWLASASGCEAEVDGGGWVGIDPGASPTGGCSPSLMENLVGTVVLIPYFDDFRSTGAGAEYHVAGFGAVYVTGYNFAGQYKEASLITGNQVCTGEERCIEGYLIDNWVVSGGELGGSDFGVVTIAFTG
jgi:hypothetical protein